MPLSEGGEDEVMEDQHRESKDATEAGTPNVAVEPPEPGADKMDVDG